MSLARRVMWKEGMFLRAQHFQQQDRRAESLAAFRAAAHAPFHWGFSRLELDEGLLEAGKVGVRACAGAYPDGAVFDAPAEATVPKALAIPSDAGPGDVWLVLPEETPGAPLGGPEADESRFAVAAEDLPNLLAPSGRPEPVELGRPRLALAFGERPEGYDALPLARVREVSQGRVKLDPDFVPPVLDVAASPAALRLTRDVAARLDARARQLAGPLGTAGGLSAGAMQQLLMLQLCNGKGALFAHLAAIGHGHPERLFAEMVETAAEVASYADRETRRPGPLPDYDHDDLTACLHAAAQAILRMLGELEDPDAFQIPLEWQPQRKIRFNRALPPDAMKDARLILLATSSLPEDQLRQALPGNVSIGGIDGFLDILRGAARSVALIHRPAVPPQMRQQAGWLCFEIDRNSAGFASIRDQRTLAIHAQDALQGLDLQLWAVKD